MNFFLPAASGLSECGAYRCFVWPGKRRNTPHSKEVAVGDFKKWALPYSYARLAIL